MSKSPKKHGKRLGANQVLDVVPGEPFLGCSTEIFMFSTNILSLLVMRMLMKIQIIPMCASTTSCTSILSVQLS
jgi:hypothetical protein